MSEPNHEQQQPRRITGEEVRARVEAGEPVVFLDARSEESWRRSDVQIPGSIRVPPDDIDRHLDAVPAGRPIVTYCT
jgi:hypothetical protein